MSALPDIHNLQEQLDAADRDAQALIAGLTEPQGCWRADARSWSVAQCLDHLARTNRTYLEAMKQPASRARADGRFRRGPAVPGLLGRWFAKTLEPPVKGLLKARAPRIIQPLPQPSLNVALASFSSSQNEVREFITTNEDLDLADILFPNPFVRGIRFSLATGLQVIAAHERRHLWQASRIREAAQREAAGIVQVRNNSRVQMPG